MKVVLERKPFVLIIRDGWGYNPDPNEDAYNTTKVANVPTDRMLMSEYPNTLIHTHGEYVGLPDGTMGNSEVGHQNIGAGRIVPQESVRLSRAIKDETFFKNKHFTNCIKFVKENKGKMHVMGLSAT
jgi:2,3-bisphosphoglycerate-independent phosphoglycerate mutase